MKTFVLAISSLVLFAFGDYITDPPGSASSVDRTAASYGCVNAGDFFVEKYKKYSVIALDEGPHATVQTHEFLRSLFTHRKFIQTVNYVILEFINRDHQEVVDKYISGEKVAISDLKQAWRHGTQAHSENFERSVYLKLLEAIREANLQLPIENKIRVLAGDPKIEWNNVNSLAQYQYSLSQRDIYPGQIAMAYGIKDQRKVLIIFGGEHVRKKSADPKDSTFYSITQFLNRNYANSTYAIGAYKADILPAGNKECALNSIIEPTGKDEAFDAYYFAGLTKEWKQDTLLEKIESPYWEELNRRAKIVWGETLDTVFRKPGSYTAPPTRQ
jgi:hypothetical protein